MKCNRTACQKELESNQMFWNSSTERYYCPRCAKKINKYNPGLCTSANPTKKEVKCLFSACLD